MRRRRPVRLLSGRQSFFAAAELADCLRGWLVAFVWPLPGRGWRLGSCRRLWSAIAARLGEDVRDVMGGVLTFVGPDHILDRPGHLDGSVI